MRIDKKLGYLVLDNIPKSSSQLVELYSKADPNKWATRKKKFMRNDNTLDLNSPPAPFLDLAHLTYGCAKDYLGEEPILYTAGVTWSHKHDLIWQESQLYHCDWEDDHTIKVFVYMRDVEIENGPLTFIDATNSALIRKKLNYHNDKSHRIDDNTIYSIHDKPIVVTGKAGTTILVDTCACFHYGSRILDGDRLIAHIQFLKPNHRGIDKQIKFK